MDDKSFKSISQTKCDWNSCRIFITLRNGNQDPVIDNPQRYQLYKPANFCRSSYHVNAKRIWIVVIILLYLMIASLPSCIFASHVSIVCILACNQNLQMHRAPSLMKLKFLFVSRKTQNDLTPQTLRALIVLVEDVIALFDQRTVLWFDIFLETKKHQNLMRHRFPIDFICKRWPQLPSYNTEFIALITDMDVPINSHNTSCLRTNASQCSLHYMETKINTQEQWTLTHADNKHRQAGIWFEWRSLQEQHFGTTPW